MLNRLKHLKYIYILVGGAVFCSVFNAYAHPLSTFMDGFMPQIEVPEKENEKEEATDSISTKYRVNKTAAESPEDLNSKTPIDLKDPENVKRNIEFDHHTGNYVIKTMVGDQVVATPFSLNEEEFTNYTEKQMMRKYFHEKNTEIFEKGSESAFNFLDMQFGLGPAEKIFGPGEIGRAHV